MSAEARYLEPELPEELGVEYRRTFERLRGHFRVRGISSEEAADMAQEAAMRAYMHVRRRGVTGENLFPLMNQIARNMMIDRHRRGGPQLVPIEDAEHVGDATQDPTETIVSLEARRAVREAVDALPERHRDAILMALQGLTPAQVAERMGIARNAADALLHRARRSLKDRLRVVSDGALGLATLAYLKLRGGRRGGFGQVGDPVLIGTLQGSIGAAAAALVIALNVGSPMQTAVAGASAARAHAQKAATAAVVDAAPARAVEVNPVAGSAGGSSGGRSFDGGFLQAGQTGDGGVQDGSTEFKVNNVSDASGNSSLAGIEYEAWQDPNNPDTVKNTQARALAVACRIEPTACD